MKENIQNAIQFVEMEFESAKKSAMMEILSQEMVVEEHVESSTNLCVGQRKTMKKVKSLLTSKLISLTPFATKEESL